MICVWEWSPWDFLAYLVSLVLFTRPPSTGLNRPSSSFATDFFPLGSFISMWIAALDAHGLDGYRSHLLVDFSLAHLARSLISTFPSFLLSSPWFSGRTSSNISSLSRLARTKSYARPRHLVQFSHSSLSFTSSLLLALSICINEFVCSYSTPVRHAFRLPQPYWGSYPRFLYLFYIFTANVISLFASPRGSDLCVQHPTFTSIRFLQVHHFFFGFVPFFALLHSVSCTAY